MINSYRDALINSRGVPPSELFMVFIWDALIKYSKNVKDLNKAVIAQQFANYISDNNISHTELQQVSQLQSYVGIAMSQYRPTRYGDYSAVFNVHLLLEKWIPGYHMPLEDTDSE